MDFQIEQSSGRPIIVFVIDRADHKETAKAVSMAAKLARQGKDKIILATFVWFAQVGAFSGNC